MKQAIYVLVLAVILIGLASCDRFEHAFQPASQVNFALELFTPLQAGFDAATANDLSPAMTFYSDDYLQFGVSKSDWENQLQGYITGITDPQFEVTMSSTQLQNETHAVANWRLKIINPDTKAVVMDSLFVGENLVKTNNRWLLRGNQMTCDPPTAKQTVVVEYITNIGCSYCPAVEAKLHELAALYPNQFIYLTHQLTGPVSIADALYQYYNAFSAPISIIQGQYKLAGGTQDVLDQYSPLVESLVQVDNPLIYQVFNPQITGTTVSGSIGLTLQTAALPKTDMILNVALIEQVSSATSFSGEFLTNVVLARQRIDITNANLAEPIEFSITDDHPLPDDLSLVVFAQTTPSPFANNATIHSGLLYPLNPTRSK